MQINLHSSTVFFKAFFLGLLFFLVSCESAEPKPELLLESPHARLSYGIGFRMGKRMTADEMPIDIAAYTAGLSDAILNLEPGLTDEEIDQVMMSFQDQSRKQAEEKRLQVAESNKDEGRIYMSEMKTRGDVKVTASGLQYIVIDSGEGESPTLTDSVEVHYEGRLIDGTIFDSSLVRNKSVTFRLNQVIPGWTEGLQLMKPGGRFKFIIPSELGYGEGGAGETIGPNATLLFDVELIEVIEYD